MSGPPVLIDAQNISLAWGQALLAVMGHNGVSSPLVISVGGFRGAIPENSKIRDSADYFLNRYGLEPVANTASTIFPYKQWLQRQVPRAEFFKFYLEKLYPRIKQRRRANQYGVYFYRMLHYVGSKESDEGGSSKPINQLEYVIEQFLKARARGSGIRNSALQIACFDPVKDDTGQVQRGFPCLQQVGFTYEGDNLSLHAFYPTEYIFDRGYGNYLGLCQLGLFVAEQLHLNFVQFYCYVGRPVLGSGTKTGLHKLALLIGEERERTRESE